MSKFFTEDEKLYLNKMKDKCIKRAKKYRKKIKLYKKLNHFFSIPLILTNVVTLVLNAWGDINGNDIKIATIAVLGINSVSTGFIKYLNLDKKIQVSTKRKINYERLSEEIKINLASRNPKMNFDDFADKKMNLLTDDDDDDDIELGSGLERKEYNEKQSYSEKNNNTINKNDEVLFQSNEIPILERKGGFTSSMKDSSKPNINDNKMSKRKKKLLNKVKNKFLGTISKDIVSDDDTDDDELHHYERCVASSKNNNIMKKYSNNFKQICYIDSDSDLDSDNDI